MLRIERYIGRQISKPERVLRKLVLPFDLRRKSRFRTTLEDGTEAALFLPRGLLLRDGDILEAEDGTRIRVESAPENVLLVTAETPHALMRAAYHLGNRHTPVELGEEFLKLEADPVLEEMLRHLGVTVREERAPFQPEGGAYDGGHRHESDHPFAADALDGNHVSEQDVHPHGEALSSATEGASPYLTHDDFHTHEHS
jgi:urease accessory protein